MATTEKRREQLRAADRRYKRTERGREMRRLQQRRARERDPLGMNLKMNIRRNEWLNRKDLEVIDASTKAQA